VHQPLLWAPLVAIAAAALAAEIPFFLLGTPSGHDLDFHLYSWLEVLAQWKQGIGLPRWAALAHFGYGEPRFVFYPPASWTLGAALSAVFPWRIVPALYIWMVLVLAGVAMFCLARRWLGRRDAIFAALLYTVNPYHLVIVYWRSALAELLASCLVPLLLLYVLKAVDGKRALVPLSLVLAAAWLTNAPAAVMIHYSFALLIVFFAWKQKSWRLLMIGAGAVAVGACLAAFYLLPAIYEQRWVNIAQVVSAGSRPQDSFLFIHTTDAEHDAFNKIVSWVAGLEMVVIFVAAVKARLGGHKDARQEVERRKDGAWTALLVWGAAASVLMFPITLFFWNHLPKLAFMQFPWRWLLCLSMVFAILVSVGWRSWWVRGAVCALSLLVIVGAWHRVQAPWWDSAEDLREIQDNMASGTGSEGTDEYTPLGADPTEIDQGARQATVVGSAHAAIHVLRWNAESRVVTAEMSGADQLALRLFRYPAWQVRVNDRVVETFARAETGQMLVPVDAGMNRVEITFVRTWDRRAGGWISVVTALALVMWVLWRRSSILHFFFTFLPSACHSERSEEPMHSARAGELHRSFASLRMTGC
jgi:hypothetical protein